MQGSARKDVVFGAAGVYPVTVPGPKWKSWFEGPVNVTVEQNPAKRLFRDAPWCNSQNGERTVMQIRRVVHEVTDLLRLSRAT